MKYAVILAALAAFGGSTLLTTGCADVDSKELDDLDSKITKLDLKFSQKNDMQALLSDELVKQSKNLVERLVQMEVLLKSLQASVDRMDDIVRGLQAAAREGTPNSAPGAAPDESGKPRALKAEEIQMEIERVLAQLRSGKLRTEEAALQLKPYAKHAAPRLVDEIRESIAKYDYTKQLETVLSLLPPAELKVPLQKALVLRGARDSAARIVGAVRDPELAKILEEHAGSADEDFRLLAGDALVRCRNKAGIPPLLQSLKSDQAATRTIAIAALKRINRGEAFGYSAPLTAEQNAAAIKAWEVWAEKYGGTIFD